MTSALPQTGENGPRQGDGRRPAETHEAESFPRQLARLRKEHGWTLDELAERVTYNRSYLHKLESGERTGSADAVRALDEVYGARGLLHDSWRTYKRGAYLGRFREFMALEERAAMMEKYSPAVIPGLFQTETYARVQLGTARCSDPQQLTTRIETRIGRQKVLTRADPPEVRGIIDESALLRPLPDLSDWVEQLAHLIELARRPHVAVQVLPLSAGLQRLLGGSLTVLWMPDGKSVAYEESSTNGNLIDDQLEVQSFRKEFDQLRDDSLKPRDSVAYIERLMDEARLARPSEPESR